MPERDAEEHQSPFSEEPTGGRYLFVGLLVLGVLLLSIIRWQTRPGDVGQVGVSGGWWSEPFLAPALTLILLIVSSGVAILASRRETLELLRTGRDYVRIGLLSAWMLVAVWLISILGFALAMLIFSGGLALAAGFRGVRLVALSLGTTVVMVLVFRVFFSIWFPRPWLFKVLDLGSPWSWLL